MLEGLSQHTLENQVKHCESAVFRLQVKKKHHFQCRSVTREALLFLIKVATNEVGTNEQQQQKE